MDNDKNIMEKAIYLNLDFSIPTINNNTPLSIKKLASITSNAALEKCKCQGLMARSKAVKYGTYWENKCFSLFLYARLIRLFARKNTTITDNNPDAAETKRIENGINPKKATGRTDE